MTIGRFFGRGIQFSGEEPDYIDTIEHDGRKRVDSDKFVKEAEVRNQVNQLHEVIESQLRRADRA